MSGEGAYHFSYNLLLYKDFLNQTENAWVKFNHITVPQTPAYS